MKILLILVAFTTLTTHAESNLMNTSWVGLSSVDVTPEIGTPLGGYGGSGRRLKLFLDWTSKHPLATYLKPSTGIHDPIRSKAMIIKNSRRTILFLSLDVVGITLDVYKDISKRLKKYNIDDIIISATHTHSGPGALSKSIAWQVIAMDKFNKKVYNPFIQGILHSVDLAFHNLEPAQLYQTHFEVNDLQVNRRKNPGYFDKTASLLIAKRSDGTPLGGLVHFAVHGCALGEENLLFSADVSGGIERHLEELLAQNGHTPTMLFINGAEGDVSNHYGGFEGIEKSGEIFATTAQEYLDQLIPVSPYWNTGVTEIRLDQARLNLKKCGVKIGKKGIRIPISSLVLPRKARLWQIKWDNFIMMTYPGEPTTSIGFATKDMALANQYPHAWVMGLTNGHMGYFLTSKEYDEGGYESCATLHGPKAGEKLLKAHQKLLSPK